MRDKQQRWLAATLGTLLLAFVPPLRGQGGLSLFDDASLVPRGVFRFRTPVIWTRYDQRFGKSGLTPLGAPYTADSLGPAQMNPLAITQGMIQAAAGSPFTLSLGKSRLDAMAREEQMPFMFEYGILERLSLSLVVPVVRKRLSGVLRLDSAGGNVGPNPQRLSAAAAANNAQVQQQFSTAAQQLQTKLTSCTSNPAGAGCAALLARQAEAQALILSSQNFAGTVGALYGVTGGSGEAFVPRASSSAQSAIALRVADFNLKFKDLLVSGSDFITAIPSGAAGPAGSANVMKYTVSDLKRDSLAWGEIFGVGDAELGFKYLALDRPMSEDRRIGVRLLLGSSLRFPSGSRHTHDGIADLRIGDGAVGFDARAIGELQRGGFALLGAASFTSVGVNAAMPPSDTRRVSIDVEPRWQITEPLSVHGSYALRTADFTGNTQLAGGGVSFTTPAGWRRGTRPTPMEMRYSHLETVSGAVGAAKFTRDQLEVRIHYQSGWR